MTVEEFSELVGLARNQLIEKAAEVERMYHGENRRAFLCGSEQFAFTLIGGVAMGLGSSNIENYKRHILESIDLLFDALEFEGNDV